MDPGRKIRVGAVNYLNTKPLIYELERLAPQAELVLDLPSRLADDLAAGRLDVALIPSIEFFHDPAYTIVSDACIACRGPVLSVKLFSRVPVERDPHAGARRRLAHQRRAGADPAATSGSACGRRFEPLPLGLLARATAEADAVLLIGDRAIHSPRRTVRGRVGPGRRVVPLDRAAVCVRHVGRPRRASIWTASTRRWPRPATRASRIWTRSPRARPRRWACRGRSACRTCATTCTSTWARASSAGWSCSTRLAGASWASRRAGVELGSRRLPDACCDKAVAGERLSPDEGLRLLESHDLAALGRAADAVTRRLHPEPYRTYNIDRNINYTNVCTAVCDFCAFSRKPKRRRRLRPRPRRAACRRSRRRSPWAATRF